MPLNKEGIEQLKADLRANAQIYDQNDFGVAVDECSTRCCMAGMCLIRQVGKEEFERRVRDFNLDEVWLTTSDITPYKQFTADCISAAMAQLGLAPCEADEYGDDVPPVFNHIDNWPERLALAYEDAERAQDRAAMAEAACLALDCMDERGCFKEAAYGA